MREHNLVEVYRAKNVPQAVAFRQALEDAGIHVVIDNDFLQGAVGELPLGWTTAPRIVVARDDASRARQIIEHWEETASRTAADAQHDADIDACLACGSIMPTDSDACPKCGWSYDTGEVNDDAG